MGMPIVTVNRKVYCYKKSKQKQMVMSLIKLLKMRGSFNNGQQAIICGKYFIYLIILSLEQHVPMM